MATRYPATATDTMRPRPPSPGPGWFWNAARTNTQRKSGARIRVRRCMASCCARLVLRVVNVGVVSSSTLTLQEYDDGPVVSIGPWVDPVRLPGGGGVHLQPEFETSVKFNPRADAHEGPFRHAWNTDPTRKVPGTVSPTNSFDSTGRTSAITVDHLTKRYQRIAAVDDISFEVPEGQLLALLGPNGAGKSTTIDMILGLARPDAGRISLFGRTPADAVAAGAIGGMLQTGALIEYLSVRELITMAASLYPHPLPTGEVMELTGTAAFGDRQTNKLSGGQVQRVRFAVALVADSDLLLLDEPTSALDVEGRHEFWSSMRAVAARGKTVLFATHYLEEADAYADRIVLLARGRIVADGSTTEIKAKVGSRTIRATLPGADMSELTALRGVTTADRQGDTVTLTCRDADAALRSLLDRFSLAHDVEVRGAGIEEAFVALTADADNLTTIGGTNR